VPFPAGGSLDALTRIVTQNIGERTGMRFVVDNKAGANGNIGARSALQAAPDGRTWLFGHDALITVNEALYAKQGGFDARADLKALRGFAQSPSILVVHPDFGPKTIAEFIEFGRKTEIVYASGGIGAAGHLTMEQFGRTAGLKLRHVPYRGGAPATNDLIAGQVSAAFLAIGGAMAQVQAGTLRALAVSTLKRSAQAPDVPTVAESGYPGFESVETYFVFVSSKTAPKLSEEIGRELGISLSDAAVQERIRKLGIEPVQMDAQACEGWLEKAYAMKTRLIAEIGLEPQ
jgi:tripartite-type tricarboxylate transporter receptor subunit TctC